MYAAGLNPKETLVVDALVRKVADAGVTVVLVEHDMKMVMNLSDRIPPPGARRQSRK